MSASKRNGKSAGPGPNDVDDKALELRCEGRAFVKIAETLGLDRSGGAIAAFNRSLRRRPAAEQERLLAEEIRRLDTLASRVRKNTELDAQDADRRLRAVERMRALILAK